MNRLLHIFVQPRSGVTNEKLEETMNVAIDWYRYAPGAFIVYTSSNENKWQERLSPLVEPEGSLLILPLGDHTEAQGWMTEPFWKWLNKGRKLS